MAEKIYRCLPYINEKIKSLRILLAYYLDIIYRLEEFYILNCNEIS